jgi:mRNA interferase MazF
MPRALPGEVWTVDLGLAAKVRPCLVLTLPPLDNELSLVNVVAHTTSALPDNPWPVVVPKPWLKPGAFHVQMLYTIPPPKFARRLGILTTDEFSMVKSKVAQRLGITAGDLARTAP